MSVLTESEALTFALARINAESYMWENKKNEAFLKKEQNDNNASYYPKGELMISAGLNEKIAQNFRLAYRFVISRSAVQVRSPAPYMTLKRYKS